MIPERIQCPFVDSDGRGTSYLRNPADAGSPTYQTANRETAMPKMIFVSLPVRNLDTSIAFYQALGLELREPEVVQ